MEFKYIAKNAKTGKKISDITHADSASELIARLKKRGYLPVKIEGLEKKAATKEKAKSAKKSKSIFLYLTEKVSGKELAIFSRQLAATLGSGLLLTEAIETISEDMENDYFKRILDSVRIDIEGGLDFSAALSKFPRVFSTTYTAIVKAGEATGNLHKTMASLAKYLENYERIKNKVQSAIRYPLFVVGFAFAVVLVMVLFLIPKFKGMFTGAGVKLPMLTRVVVGFSEMVLQNGWIVILVILVSIVGIWYLSKNPKTRYILDILQLRLPVIGEEVIHKSLISRFCSTMGFLLSGGVGLATSIDITHQVCQHGLMQDAIGRIRKRVLSGATMSEEIRKMPIFPKLVAKMVAVGEKTGRIDDMFLKTAEYYDEEIEITLQNLTTMLEPVLIVFIGGVVLIVVLALYLPIFQLSMAVR